MYSCRLFLISSSVRSLLFSVLYCSHLCMKYSLDSSSFIVEISSLSHSIVFLSFFLFFFDLFIVHLRRPSFLFFIFFGTLHSVGYIFLFAPCFSLLFFPKLFVKPLQAITLPFCISFSLRRFWSVPPVQCYESLSIVLQVLCLPDPILESLCLLYYIIIRNLDWVIPE